MFFKLSYSTDSRNTGRCQFQWNYNVLCSKSSGAVFVEMCEADLPFVMLVFSLTIMTCK